jgi:SAM-dependent methyltransferase
MKVTPNFRSEFDRLVEIARTKTPLFADIWNQSREKFGDDWVQEVSQNLRELVDSNAEKTWESALRGYAEFALDAMRHQKYFEKHRRYKWSSLQEIQERYYTNEKHMMENYLPGMFLSHFVWPHHFRLLSFFRNRVLSSFSTFPVLFYDVGIGSGIYSREVLRRFPEVRGKGFDISPYSVAFTRKLLEAAGLMNRYDFVLGNVFSATPERTADFVISQEVLEHLEKPQQFIDILYNWTRNGGKAYITAAINAAHSDHIYLFRSPEEVETMLKAAGWTILDRQAELAYTGTPLEITPCVAGFFCQR